MEANKRFVNEYEYNREGAKEVTGSWWDYKFKKMNMVSIILMILEFLVFFITGKKSWLILGLLMLFVLVLFALKKRNAIKIELERMAVIYKCEAFNVKYIFDEKIHLITSQRDSEVELDTIEAFVETENFVVLMMKGSMTIAFHKHGFTEGTYEEFVLHLKEIIK